MVKIIITGDNHLNLYNQKLGAKLAERRSRIGKAWNQTIDYAIKEKVDIYIHTGDLFDQISPRNPPRAGVIKAFKRLNEAGIAAYIIAGNHEVPSSRVDGLSPHAVLREAGIANVFENRLSFEHKIEDIDGVKVSIAGMSYNKNLAPFENPLEEKTIPDGGDLNIAVLHYSVEDIAPPIWEEPRIKKTSIENNPQIQIFAMGHIHSHTETKVNDCYILYPGGTEHYNFGECDKETGFIVVDYDGDIKVKYVPIEAQPMKQLRVHTSNLDHSDVTGSIIKIVEENSDPDSLFQLVLEGDLPFKEYAGVDFTLIGETGTSLNFFFEFRDIIKPTGEGLEFTPSEGLNPRKKLEEIANEMIEGSEGRDKETWIKALDFAVSYYTKEDES